MNKPLFWIAGFFLLLLLGVFFLVRMRSRSRQSDEIKRRADKIIADIVSEKDANISTLSGENAELKAKFEAQQNEAKKLPNQLVGYPQNPQQANLELATQSDADQQQEIVPNSETKPKPVKLKVIKNERAKPQREEQQADKNTHRKASPEENTAWGFASHALAQTDREGQIKILQEFLSNPVARIKKGVAQKMLNKLQNTAESPLIQ